MKRKTYEEKVIECFRDLSEADKGDASPAMVLEEMSKRGWLSPTDSVVDITKLMNELKDKGLL